MHEHELMSLGLTDKEAAVYEALLRSGPAGMPKLQEITPYKRGDLYNILAGLEGWGLVEGEGDGHKTYAPIHPSRLQEIASEQEQEVRETKKRLEQTLPGLNSLFHMISGRPGVRVFEGRGGFKEALFDSLSATETIYTHVDLDAVAKYADDVNMAYVRARQKAFKDKKILVLDTPGSRAYLQRQGKDYTDIRFLPKDMKPFSTGMQIYDNKISYFTLRERDIISVLIEDPNIYRMHRNMFDYLWDIADKDSDKIKNTEVKHGDGNVSVFNN